jgi:acyl-CoA thioesterase I
MAFFSLSLCVMAQAKPLHLVAFGDSLMAGYQLPEKDSFPAQLEQKLRAAGYDVTVINAGVSGDTASDGAERVDWSVADDTDLVLLELGANDMLRGLDPKLPRAALKQILTRLQARKMKVLLCGMKAAPNLGADYATQFEAIYPDLAEQFQVPLYPFFLEGIARQPEMTLNDGLHPNAQGVGVIVAHIVPVLSPLLHMP